ncbi:hypothetical protein [Streptomyces sp. RFCAC02]|uniref:hypothetical protein n=1 Tax=Streptomyces sp. RFCAC02 TaxID=2499143 RepID=UPI001F0EA2E7|nr:hypothetical protein [Streptomyces sp. RFCAC02]
MNAAEAPHAGRRDRPARPEEAIIEPGPLLNDPAQADAWADVLVRHGLLHAAVRTPAGPWLVQATQHSPVHLLEDAGLLGLTAAIQQHRRTRITR